MKVMVVLAGIAVAWASVLTVGTSIAFASTTPRAAILGGPPTLIALTQTSPGTPPPIPEGGFEVFDPGNVAGGPQPGVFETCAGVSDNGLNAAVVVGADVFGVDNSCHSLVVANVNGTGQTVTPVADSYGIARSPDGSVVYTVGAQGLSVIDTFTRQVDFTLPVAGVVDLGTASVNVDPYTGDIWIDTSGGIRVTSPDSFATLATIPSSTADGVAGRIAFTPGDAWIPSAEPNSVSGFEQLDEVSTTTFALIHSVDIWGTLGDAVAPIGDGHVYVQSNVSQFAGGPYEGDVIVSDVTASTLAVGVVTYASSAAAGYDYSWTDSLALSADGGSLYASFAWRYHPDSYADEGYDTVAAISTSSDTVTSTWTEANPGGYVASSTYPMITGLITGPPQPPPTAGYWQVAADGGVFTAGDAPFWGSAGNLHLNQPIVGMAATSDGKGYWLVAADGGVFTYGDAVFYGSAGNLHLNQPVVGMAATPDGGGYWLVAADGGVFTYGDAVFHGSAGALRLNAPVVGMAPTHDGKGYWLVAADGGVFAYGDAVYHGSAGAVHLSQPIVGMATTLDGGGYWLAAADGGVFTYGDATFYGSAAGSTAIGPFLGIAATPSGNGYWLSSPVGVTAGFGDAGNYGSMAGTSLTSPIVGAAATPAALACLARPAC